MKKLFVILVLLLSACTAACGEELPQEVLKMWHDAWPGYEATAWYGWADAESGQLLAALENAGDYILCMAEKKPSEPWRLTLEAPNALRDNEVPDLYLDTDGDTLFFSYWENDKKIQYCASRAPSGGKEWGEVSAIVYDGLEQWTLWGQDGRWCCEYFMVDENDNILAQEIYPPVEMGSQWEEELKLTSYLAGSLPLHPDGWK